MAGDHRGFEGIPCWGEEFFFFERVDFSLEYIDGLLETKGNMGEGVGVVDKLGFFQRVHGISPGYGLFVIRFWVLLYFFGERMQGMIFQERVFC